MKTEPSVGVTGAKRESWRGTSARALVKRFFDRLDEPTVEQVTEDFWDHVEPRLRRGEARTFEVVRTAIENYVGNTVRSLLRDEARNRRPEAATRQHYATANTAAARQMASAYVKIRLLSMLMPNGKEFGDCTKEEIAANGRMLGQLHRAVLPLLKDGQTPRQANLKESQLRKLSDLPRRGRPAHRRKG